MITDINAQAREHIFYDTLKGVLLYHNDLANYPLHWHNEVELILILSGSLKVKFHNDASAVIDCAPGDIIMIAPGTLHEYISDSPGGEKLILLFDIATYSQVSSLVPLLKTLPPYTHIQQTLYPVETARLQNYFWEIDRLYGKQDEFLQISVYSLVSLILAQIGSMHLGGPHGEGDAPDSQRKNIDKLVESQTISTLTAQMTLPSSNWLTLQDSPSSILRDSSNPTWAFPVTSILPSAVCLWLRSFLVTQTCP